MVISSLLMYRVPQRSTVEKTIEDEGSFAKRPQGGRRLSEAERQHEQRGGPSQKKAAAAAAAPAGGGHDKAASPSPSQSVAWEFRYRHVLYNYLTGWCAVVRCSARIDEEAATLRGDVTKAATLRAQAATPCGRAVALRGVSMPQRCLLQPGGPDPGSLPTALLCTPSQPCSAPALYLLCTRLQSSFRRRAPACKPMCSGL